MNFVERPIGVKISDDVSARGLDELPLGERKWPIHYDSVEPLAVVADVATITLASVVSGLLYHLYGTGTPGDIGKSVGSAVLVSALFISVMKIRGMYGPTELLVLCSTAIPHAEKQFDTCGRKCVAQQAAGQSSRSSTEIRSGIVDVGILPYAGVGDLVGYGCRFDGDLVGGKVAGGRLAP
jgi:hypothetical protein